MLRLSVKQNQLIVTQNRRRELEGQACKQSEPATLVNNKMNQSGIASQALLSRILKNYIYLHNLYFKFSAKSTKEDRYPQLEQALATLIIDEEANERVINGRYNGCTKRKL